MPISIAKKIKDREKNFFLTINPAIVIIRLK